MNTSTIGFRPQTHCCSEPLFRREAKCNRKGFALSSLVSKVKVYGTWQNLPIVDKSLVATAQAGPGRGGGGYSWEFLAGLCLTLFQTKKCHFPHLFSDKTSKIHTRFQTLPLGRNYVIITSIRAQTKNFFKRISNSHISIQSFLFFWD